MSLGFYYDNTRCIGCRVCQIACKDRLDLQEAGPRTRRVDSYETGTYPRTGIYHMSVSCNHCESPACVANCPTGAMHKDADGIVLHDDDVCIQCKACVEACPYDAPQYVEAGNLIIKCDTCKPLREAGHLPVCVEACPLRALDFGEMDDLREKYGNDLVRETACLPSADETDPNLLIKGKAIAFEEYRAISL